MNVKLIQVNRMSEVAREGLVCKPYAMSKSQATGTTLCNEHTYRQSYNYHDLWEIGDVATQGNTTPQ